ncbi:MAG: type III-B CRISPR-associated protein Cas10/Cmr2 [Desulfamplus sp.]|nr:type III-B CRISPR-associated protein Cas10/Cmr2 [Desulfamplus sp.]
MKIRDDDYWEQKMRIFLHDPMDKALMIQGHENRARDVARALGISTPSKDEVWLFDVIAAGLDRANLPGYSFDPSKNGAVDFMTSPQITHPVSRSCLEFTGQCSSAAVTTGQIVEIIHRDTDDTAIRWDKKTFFNYLFFVLRKRIVMENCGNLGFLWDKMPADTRIPDHSIWNHAGMVSALYTSMKESENHRASMVVFAITPVQPFINKTRKLRDHWVASVILSWLTFEGICQVMDMLGPDHLLYPSLQDQPLVEALLSKDFGSFFQEFRDWSSLSKDEGVASFPNKFLFLAPGGREASIAQGIEAGIRSRWKELSGVVLEWLEGDDGGGVASIFHRQSDGYWQFNWSSANLVTLENQESMEVLFHKDKFREIFKTVEDFSASWSHARFAYPVTHSLVQTVMAASKSVPTVTRTPEPGIKCPVCGEFEILHGGKNAGASEGEYKKYAHKFWNRISRRLGGVVVKEGEELCAICAIKRLAPHALEKYARDHILRTLFKDGSFPSTTEMATVEFRERLREKGVLPPLTPSGGMEFVERDLIDELHMSGDEGLSPAGGALSGGNQDESKNPGHNPAENCGGNQDEPENPGHDPAENCGGSQDEWENSDHDPAENCGGSQDEWENPDHDPPGNARAGHTPGVRKVLSRGRRLGIVHSEPDLYYAILMMDGDKMGDLVNGSTVDARWEDVLHPGLVQRYKSGTLVAKKELWMGDKNGQGGYLAKQRILSPALHATLSESLGTFSLHVVPHIIRQCQGKLIYAGGDDVAAVLPLSRVLEAASAIQRAYNMPFAAIINREVVPVTKTFDGSHPIMLLPGKGEGISISAGIVLCHHKQPLRGALEESHALLDGVAKKRTGRNAVAIRLKKRSGHQRDFAVKWGARNPFVNPDSETSTGSDARVVTSFLKVQDAYGEGILSGSLLYRLPELKVMVHSVLNRDGLSQVGLDRIVKIFSAEIYRSGNLAQRFPGKSNSDRREAMATEAARHIAGMTIAWDKKANQGRGAWHYNADAPIIARYLSRGGSSI